MFFSRIIKLTDEGNTLDIMNLAFSRALDRGLCRLLNVFHSGVGGKLASLGSPAGGMGDEEGDV